MKRTMPSVAHQLCCQHLCGPDPDPEALAREVFMLKDRMDVHDFPETGRAHECECHAIAKHRLIYMGTSLFLCNPCAEAFVAHMAAKYDCVVTP